MLVVNVSNELNASAFVSSAVLTLEPTIIPFIQWQSQGSPEMDYAVRESIQTPIVTTPQSVTVLSIPMDTELAGWYIKSLLLTEIQHTPEGSIAKTWLEGVCEYGTSKDENEALSDLVTSLGEYRESLEDREDSLGESARKDLIYLRKLIDRISG